MNVLCLPDILLLSAVEKSSTIHNIIHSVRIFIPPTLTLVSMLSNSTRYHHDFFTVQRRIYSPRRCNGTSSIPSETDTCSLHIRLCAASYTCTLLSWPSPSQSRTDTSLWGRWAHLLVRIPPGCRREELRLCTILSHSIQKTVPWCYSREGRGGMPWDLLRYRT